MKNSKKITPEQSKIIDNIYNLIWFRITNDKKYLEAIPNIDSPNFEDWIYYIRYQFLEYDDSLIEAVVYLNCKHYFYTNAPQFLNSVWVDEIKETEVKDKIIEIGGKIYEGFELYNHISIDSEDIQKMMGKLINKSGDIDNMKHQIKYHQKSDFKSMDDSIDYYSDLPF